MITHITVEDAAKLISRIAGTNEMQALTYIREAADRGEIQTADDLEKLQAENAEMQKQLNEFSEFLCHITGGLLSKTNYTAQVMISAAEDYQQKGCGECDLRAENIRWGQVASEQDKQLDKLQAELKQVKQLYESEKENFIDFACSGVPNLSPYCLNRHPDCVDERGWCKTEKCRGFSRERGQKED